MKYRSAALSSVSMLALLVGTGCPVSPKSQNFTLPDTPFSDGTGIFDIQSDRIVAFIQNGDPTYTEIDAQLSPYSILTAMSTVDQVLSGGLKNMAAVPAGPAGVGRQAQRYSVADLTGAGNLGIAVCTGGSVVVYTANSTLSSYTQVLRTG